MIELDRLRRALVCNRLRYRDLVLRRFPWCGIDQEREDAEVEALAFRRAAILAYIAQYSALEAGAS